MSDVCKDGFLPDLGNEKSGEQIVFKQKLFRANEAFIQVNQEILSWFQFPVEHRYYPKSCMNNKNGWQKNEEICVQQGNRCTVQNHKIL